MTNQAETETREADAAELDLNELDAVVGGRKSGGDMPPPSIIGVL